MIVSCAAGLCFFVVPRVAWDCWQRLRSRARVLLSPETCTATPSEPCLLLKTPPRSRFESHTAYHYHPTLLEWGEASPVSRFSRSACCLPQILSSSVSIKACGINKSQDKSYRLILLLSLSYTSPEVIKFRAYYLFEWKNGKGKIELFRHIWIQLRKT